MRRSKRFCLEWPRLAIVQRVLAESMKVKKLVAS